MFKKQMESLPKAVRWFKVRKRSDFDVFRPPLVCPSDGKKCRRKGKGWRKEKEEKIPLEGGGGAFFHLNLA